MLYVQMSKIDKLRAISLNIDDLMLGKLYKIIIIK